MDTCYLVKGSCAVGGHSSRNDDATSARNDYETIIARDNDATTIVSIDDATAAVSYYDLTATAINDDAAAARDVDATTDHDPTAARSPQRSPSGSSPSG